MKTQVELMNELSEVLAPAVTAETSNLDGAGDMGVLTKQFANWFVEQIRIFGCDNSDIIVETVEKFVKERVTNVLAQQLILTALQTAKTVICG